MDIVQDWATYFLNDDHAAYSSYAYKAYSLANTARSWILPIIDQIAKKPDLATLALLVIILFVSLKILNMLVQSVLFWFRLARRLAFWGGLAALALWMWSRGPEGMISDVQYWWGVWNQEYGKEKENVARLAQQGMDYGRQRQRQGGNVGWF